MPMNWLYDPLLLDTTPTLSEKWLTANDLLKYERDTYLSTSGYFILYSIMIRKSDFSSSERLLQSFPYILLDDNWCEAIRKQTLTLAEKVHYYFQKSNILSGTIALKPLRYLYLYVKFRSGKFQITLSLNTIVVSIKSHGMS